MSEPRRFTNHDPIVPFLNHCDASEPIRFVNTWGVNPGWLAQHVPSCDNCGGGDAYPFTILETQFHLCPSCTKMIAVSALRKTPDYEHQIKLTLLSQRAARNADGKQYAES